ncbi:MBL fold metallo-hydrolase [Adhaeribacter arboris]|uniref:MBL fold metallo-hydrolase n=1 Tax=Adhaeribacter arboris TaxID=2072846 RepID=A0A2T2YJL2_9BACT|nr:MBL fold metallo-hydrolase [Adhaeribacter arboris]PSR55691.1 MBL fold metallo-hydrolase [Adhaeribacter arboris]
MTISFYGAAQTVTGSKHLVTLENGTRILLDCGLLQGKGEKTDDYNREFDFEPENINYLILSHAHIDHSGLIPRLVKMGFSGPVFCTPPTLELCELLLRDSARIQENNSSHGTTTTPLYTEADVESALQLFKTVPYDQPYRIDDRIELLFTDTGHVLGSAAINLKLQDEEQERTLCFSGDIGRFANRILKEPQPFPAAEIILCESTYGDKIHDSLEHTEERLEQIVQTVCVERQGKLLIPAFSIGRTQELIYSLNYLAEEGRLPENVKVFVDSPLSVYATDILRSNPDYFNDTMQEYLKIDSDPFGFPQLHYIIEAEDSKELNNFMEPCVIISSSGMMEAGRIQHHLKNNLSDPNSAVLITGYCEPSTLGGQLLKGAETVRILGEEVAVKAEMIVMKEYSAHADYSDIAKFLICQDKEKLQKIFQVHGEKPVMVQLKEDLTELGYSNIEITDFRLSYVV